MDRAHTWFNFKAWQLKIKKNIFLVIHGNMCRIRIYYFWTEYPFIFTEKIFSLASNKTFEVHFHKVGR
jgi:hypothetical protein